MSKPLISRILTGCALVVGVSGAVGTAHATGLTRPVVPAGRNLLGNPGAQTGVASVQGWDSVTIPGWTIVRGLPTVVRYGTKGFPAAYGSFPAAHGGQLFAGGLGGTAVLRQVIRLRSASGGPLARGARFA